MSGKRIDDHAFFAGKAEKGTVFPKGVHVKHETSAEGAGEVGMYEDTDSAIKKQQDMGISKVKGHSQKPHHRY